MRRDSAPSPDGFGVSFYKQFWGLIKDEVMQLVNDFYLGNLGIARLDYGVITLLPKVKDANTVKQFRPICLLNVSFKIFTKLLLGRLTNLVEKLFSKNQSAFIRGRYILDSVVTLHEVLHEMRQKKLRGVVLKIDFEKAYDSVRWDFLEQILDRKGFHPTMRDWIMQT